MMQRPWQLAICAATLAVAVSSSVAEARPTKIALTKVEGDASGVGKAVSDALEDSELVIVPPRQVDRTIIRLGLDDNFSERGAAKLGEELEVDAVVRTAYDRRRNRMRFTIFANGKRGKPFSIEVTDAQSDKFRRTVRTAVLAKLGALRKEADAAADAVTKPDPAPAAGPTVREGKDGKKLTIAEPDKSGPVTSTVADPKKAKGKPSKDVAKTTAKPAPAPAPIVGPPSPSEQPTKPPQADPSVIEEEDEPEEAKNEKPADPPFAKDAKATAATRPSNSKLAAAKPQLASAREDDGDTASASSGSGTTLRAEVERPSKRGVNTAAVRVELGASLAARSLSFTAATPANAPKTFSSAAFPGGRVDGEIYPFAMGESRGALSGIGIAGTFDQAVPLTVHTAAAPTVGINASERNFSIGLRYRYAFGNSATSPTLTAGAGYASREFSIEKTAANASTLDLPNVSYTMIDPSLAFRLPLGQRFAVSVAGKFLVIADAGDIQSNAEYGGATAMGMNGAAGLDIMLGQKLALRLAGEATQINFDFTGTGTKASSRGVKSASDTYVGGAATLAVMY